MTSRFSRIAGSLISAGVLAFSVLSATATDVRTFIEKTYKGGVIPTF